MVQLVLKPLKALKRYLLNIVLLGTVGSHSLAENRITIFSNILALFCGFAALTTFFSLRNWGAVEVKYLFFYFTIPFAGFLTLFLNSLGKTTAARITGVVILNLAAWNALIFYGKSFNGYLLFYAAIVFSIMALKTDKAYVNWYAFGGSAVGLFFADYFSYKKIFPITQLHSSDAPISLLISDTIIIILIMASILFIEKFLARKNEQELLDLNQNLEDIVQKRTALLNIAKAEALQASKAKSQFLANTSHELRTPLGAILGFIDLISSKQSSEQEKQLYLETIQRNANQLLQIVNEVLDLSKIEAQKLHIEKENVNLNELMEDIRLSMSLKSEAKGLLFKIEEKGPIPQEIYTDPLRLKQILLNLIGNAIKFTDKGEIVVQMELKRTDEKSFIVFDIIDTGLGIAPNNVQTLFEPFFQADSTYMRKFGGTGLGLSLSKSLAELLGGKLNLEKTELGNGSTFRLTMECIIKNKAQNNMNSCLVLANNEEMHLSNKKILLVDDSKDNQFLINHYLTRSGADVDIANNGLDAVNKVTSNSGNYDIILMDLQMPIMDGYEAASKIKEQGFIAPIVAFTAHAMQEEQIRTREAGFAGYLTKPIDKKRLINTLANLTNLNPTEAKAF